MFGVQECQKGKYADHIYLANSKARGVFADGVAGQPGLSPFHALLQLHSLLSFPVGGVESQLHTTIT